MKAIWYVLAILVLSLMFIQCKDSNTAQNKVLAKNTIEYAKGFSILEYEGFSIVTVSNPWPNASMTFTYVLKKKDATIPDSLNKHVIINVPIQSLVVTSTTHIPSIEMLEEADALVGFPHLDYISSTLMRKRIEENKLKEVGLAQQLNVEVLLELQPDIIMGHGIDNNNPALENLQKSGLKVLINGDWNESTPLGKAEWIKVFGALFCKEKLADSLYATIRNDYFQTASLVKNVTSIPTVLMGDMYDGHWYLPNGDSWVNQILKVAKGNYLWNESKGTGSLSLSFESVFEKAHDANIWISSGQFTTLKSMLAANPHYAQFEAFKNKNVFSLRKNKEGAGTLYYELGPNRPDIVLKDIVKILHPELLPDHQLFFFENLK